jgi:hypothetical protein
MTALPSKKAAKVEARFGMYVIAFQRDAGLSKSCD